MALPTIFETCEPREDVVRGVIQDADFAADLAQVLRGEAPEETRIPARFFANTHPTEGLKALLHNVCLRLAGTGGEVSSIFRLHTQYGGGKTHALIALAHAAGGMAGVSGIDEFVDPALVPRRPVRIAAFDGENAEPASGRVMGSGVRAFTPWGEIAYQLGGPAGYEMIRANDEMRVPPGAETIRALFGGEPTLILLDELGVFLRRVQALPLREQLVPFLTSLFKAVEGSPNAAVVYTLALGKLGRTLDAYGAENQFIADGMAEAESVSARKATLLDPTAEGETAQVVRRRLFKSIDDERARQVVEAYRDLWGQQREHLPVERGGEDRVERFRLGYPLHPEMMATFTNKLSTLGNFQRVRGMLRVLARGVRQLWEQQPVGAYAVHLHHLDPGYPPIRQEIVTRLNLPLFDAPIRNDVSGDDGGKAALAQEFDRKIYAGLPAYGSIVARPILFHTLAFNDSLKGLNERELLYSVLAPDLDPSFVDDARKRVIAESAYLDDRPNAPLRFLTEANLTQVIRRQETLIDAGEARAALNDTIKGIFKNTTLDLVPFASDPGDVPDDSGEGRPYLVLVGYDADSVRTSEVTVPALVERIFHHKGASGTDFRRNLNNLVFIVADEPRKEEMRRKVVYRLALAQLRTSERLAELAEHQRDRVMELYRRSEQEVAVAIQQCYRHVFYPSRSRLEGTRVDLNHSAIDAHSASEAPGSGQKAVVRLLNELNKLRMDEDAPDSPAYIRDRTPLKKGQISTGELRAEFRRDPSLPMLIGDRVFVKGILQGVEAGEYVYRSGDLLYGKGDPAPQIRIDEQSFVFTSAYAKEKGIWPRPAPPPEPKPYAATATVAGAGAMNETPALPLSGGVTAASPVRPADGIPAFVAAAPAPELEAEGVLREALTTLWEKARGRRLEALAEVTLRVFDATDGFRLMGAVNSVPGAAKSMRIDGGYETTDGGTTELTFSGPITDAQPVKDFLEPQLRAAKDKDVRLAFEMRFADGLGLGGNAPETLTERLARYSSGAAYVTATAKPIG